MNQHQQHVIEYLIKENRVLREQIGNRRMRFTNSQRSRLAAKAKKLSRKILENVATIVTRVQKLDLIETVGGGLPGFRGVHGEFQLRLKFRDQGLLRLANAPFDCPSRPSDYHCFEALPPWRSTCRCRRIGSRQTSIIDPQSFPSAFAKSPCPGPDNRWILFALD